MNYGSSASVVEKKLSKTRVCCGQTQTCEVQTGDKTRENCTVKVAKTSLPSKPTLPNSATKVKKVTKPSGVARKLSSLAVELTVAKSVTKTSKKPAKIGVKTKVSARPEATPSRQRGRKPSVPKTHVVNPSTDVTLNARPRGRRRKEALVQTTFLFQEVEYHPELVAPVESSSDISHTSENEPVMSVATINIEQLAINTIRTLSMDAVQAANSGHLAHRWPSLRLLIRSGKTK